MSGPLRREVLQAFKNIHRARQVVFKGDERILKDSRIKINEEFKKNKGESDGMKIHDMIAYANAVATELRTCVVQAEEKKPGVFKLNIRPETEKLDNVPFNPDVEIPRQRRIRKGENTPCCQGNTGPCTMKPCCQEAEVNQNKLTN